MSAGRDDGRGATDGVRERLAHHPAAGGDEHEEERAEQLGEQAPPFLGRVLEVLDRLLELLKLCAQVSGDGVEHLSVSGRGSTVDTGHGDTVTHARLPGQLAKSAHAAHPPGSGARSRVHAARRRARAIWSRRWIVRNR